MDLSFLLPTDDAYEKKGTIICLFLLHLKVDYSQTEILRQFSASGAIASRRLASSAAACGPLAREQKNIGI